MSAPLSKHEFAVYAASLSSQLIATSKHLLLSDPDIVHRIRSVLRLSKGEELIVFDGSLQATCSITDISKKAIAVDILSRENTTPLLPSITFLLPLLKKEAFERMIYACVELGATTIQPISTEKSQRSWRSEKELERVHKIMVAAAEQSKQFALPIIHQPCSLPEALELHATQKIKLVADPAGTPLYEVLTRMHQNMHPQKGEGIVITMGPEGDFSDMEKELLHTASYQTVKLTPTVLRSQQAGALLLGVIRSIL
jgi:16S rRNA (uracil1498-N3)-methyltransferase